MNASSATTVRVNGTPTLGVVVDGVIVKCVACGKFRRTLTVVEPSEAEAFSLGAGRVYVSARALRLLPADDRAGHDQLSFVLAHELGHHIQSLTGVRLELQSVATSLDASALDQIRDRLLAIERALAIEQRELRLFIDDLKPFTAPKRP